MIAGERFILAPNVSVAWADAMWALLVEDENHRAVNLTIRIADPRDEDPAIREFADRMLAELHLADVNEVANTIFPAEWAIDLPEPTELAADYRDHYPMLREMGSRTGTYFGRMTAYPHPEGSETIDQLSAIVEKLREEKSRGRLFKSVYEFNIYSAARDRKKDRGFPCLAHLGLHIGPDMKLNGSALYRSHDVIEKGYGNYLGLGGLVAYVADATELEPGELQVVAGGAFFGVSLSKARRYREELEALRAGSAA